MGTRTDRKKKKGIDPFYWKAALVLAAVLFLRTFVMGTIYVKGTSMEPNFHHGDLLLVNKLPIALDYEDVVICRISRGETSENIIKRVIGKPGDEIVIEEDMNQAGETSCQVWRNGELLEEAYILEPMEQIGDLEYPYTVEENHYFVLGDNRNASTDSRQSYIGTIAREDITGKVFFRLFPFDVFGTVD